MVVFFFDVILAQESSMEGSIRFVILDRSDKSSLRHWMSAFFHRRIFLLGGFGRVAVIVVSNRTISWSLLPI